MDDREEAAKWLRLGYETYGPAGVRAIADALGLPTGPFVTATEVNGAVALDEDDLGMPTCGPSIMSDEVKGSVTCPTSPPRGQAGWRRYVGDPRVFHCGFEGYLENRKASPHSPTAECFYDEWGRLVDDQHPYAGCKGTPDQYGADDWRHVWPDEGGIAKRGWGSFWESQRHAADQVRSFRRGLPRRNAAHLRPFRAPLPPQPY